MSPLHLCLSQSSKNVDSVLTSWDWSPLYSSLSPSLLLTVLTLHRQWSQATLLVLLILHLSTYITL